jgi:cytochrome P450
VVGSRPPTVDDLPKLEYADMVLHEALRLFPPVWLVGRRALVDYEVGGYAVPKGGIVVLSQWVTHHDPRWWPDPFRFDPERWHLREREKRPPYAFFPFGAGARQCIGESFALMEAKLILATIASRWSFRLAPGHRVGLKPRITLRPRGGMPMVLRRRNGG